MGNKFSVWEKSVLGKKVILGKKRFGEKSVVGKKALWGKKRFGEKPIGKLKKAGVGLKEKVAYLKMKHFRYKSQCILVCFVVRCLQLSATSHILGVKKIFMMRFD